MNFSVSSNRTFTGDQITFSIDFTLGQLNNYGVYHMLLAQNNYAVSPETGFRFNTTEYDTQVVALILQPPTPTSLTISGLSSGYTSDTTPLVTVTGLTVGATLNILDENNIVVGTTSSVTTATTTLNVSTLGEGAHTLRAVQVINGATSDAAQATVNIDTTAPVAFVNLNLPTATSGTFYTYDVQHQEEGENTITYLLSGLPDGMIISIDEITGEIQWDAPTDSFYPSTGPFNIIVRDLAGNETTQQVTIAVNSVVDISGVVFLDANSNGTADTGEGQGGVTVYADLNGNNILDEFDIATTTSTTGSVGSYTLQNVPAGSVILHQVLTDGYQQVTPTSAQLTLVQTITEYDDATIGGVPTLVEGLQLAGALAMSPDGLYVYASGGPGSSAVDDGIAVFARNPNDGTLTYIQFIENIAQLVDPNAIIVTPDGRHVYVTCQNGTGDGVFIFSRDADTGLLTEVGSITDDGTDANSNPVDNIAGTVGIIASNDGEFIYVASRNDHSVSAFARNRNTGELTLVDEFIDGTNLAGARYLTLSPDGVFLYVGDFEGITILNVDPSTGALTHLENVTGDNLSDMREMAITPDGKYLYAASDDDAKLNIFQRVMVGNEYTGALTLFSVIDAYGAPSGVTINADGTKLYMTSLYIDQINVFDIQSDGSLSHDQTLVRNNSDPLSQTLDGLDAPFTLLLDPDGHDVYVASRSSSTLEVYSDRTRTFTGAPILVTATPSTDNTGKNFLNEQVTNNVVTSSDRYNTLEFDADHPVNQVDNAPINWSTQRSIVRDITVTFEHDILWPHEVSIDADQINAYKSAVSLVRITDVNGNLTSDTITLNLDDVIVDGDELILRNLDLADDGIYQITIGTGFNTAMTDTFSTYFHQLFGDMNGDMAFNIADLSAMIYWRQLIADTPAHGYVPEYLDVRDQSAAITSDGRVDSYDFAAFTSTFGRFIPKIALPVPDLVLLTSFSEPPQPAGNLISYASNPPQTASLKIVWVDDDDDDSNTTLLDQLDDPNLVLELLETE